jgi:hypothetical protein
MPADKCIVENPTLIKKIVSETGLPEDSVILTRDEDCNCADCEKLAKQCFISNTTSAHLTNLSKPPKSAARCMGDTLFLQTKST